MMRGESERASERASKQERNRKRKSNEKDWRKTPFSINQRYSATIPTIKYDDSNSQTKTQTPPANANIVKKTPAELTRFV